MLVLSRRVSEQIVIPQSDLVLTILEVQGDRVRLGFAAPPDLHVYRREVWERIQHTPDLKMRAGSPAEDDLPRKKVGANGASQPS